MNEKMYVDLRRVVFGLLTFAAFLVIVTTWIRSCNEQLLVD